MPLEMLTYAALGERLNCLIAARSPAGDHPITATVEARVEALQAELMKLEATARPRTWNASREGKPAGR
jgi:hypothetical protein